MSYSINEIWSVKMPKCLDCGNKETFNLPFITWDKHYYNAETGEFEDSKNLSCDLDFDESIHCYECQSTNVEGEF